jgi:hypothetical protein
VKRHAHCAGGDPERAGDLGVGHTSRFPQHNGGTGGYRSFIGFVAETQVGVAVLSNSAKDVDSVGMSLLKCLHEASGAPANQRPDPTARADKTEEASVMEI